MRSGLIAARDRITPIANRYKTLGTAGVRASEVFSELSLLLRELEALKNQPHDSPTFTKQPINTALIPRRQRISPPNP